MLFWFRYCKVSPKEMWFVMTFPEKQNEFEMWSIVRRSNSSSAWTSLQLALSATCLCVWGGVAVSFPGFFLCLLTSSTWFRNGEMKFSKKKSFALGIIIVHTCLSSSHLKSCNSFNPQNKRLFWNDHLTSSIHQTAHNACGDRHLASYSCPSPPKLDKGFTRLYHM